MSDLKNCPFCGYKAEIEQSLDTFSVICIDAECGARGPYTESAVFAVQQWNARAPAPAPGVGVTVWRCLSDDPPTGDQEVLSFCAKTSAMFVGRMNVVMEYFDEGENEWVPADWATHWRPLPPPPVRDGDKL